MSAVERCRRRVRGCDYVEDGLAPPKRDSRDGGTVRAPMWRLDGRLNDCLPLRERCRARAHAVSRSAPSIVGDGRDARARLGAARATRVEVVVGPATHDLAATPSGNGYFSGDFMQRDRALATDSGSTTTRRCYPDPASRFQPDGPHGPSEIVDPSTFSLDRRDVARRAARRPGHLRAAHRHVHARRARGPRRRASCRSSRASASRCSR